MTATIVATSLALLAALGGAPAESPKLAAELVKLMNERQVTAVSAVDPSDPGRFISAMLAGPQLLVIRARYPSPVYLRERILKNEHQQVYADLHTASEKEGRVFIIDSGADGLKLARESSDVAWRNGETNAIFNLDWKTQKLQEAEYRRTFDEDEKSYAEMLSALISAMKSAATTSAQ